MPASTVPVLPDVTRPDAGAPKFSTWRVGTPQRQRAAANAIAATWDSRPWPASGLLGYSVYASTDGDTMLHHSQWTEESAYQAFVATHRHERNDAIDAAVPGIERVGLHAYELYRHTKRPGDGRVPGCIVVVDAVFDGPGPEQQRAWADAVLEALDGEERPHPGGISANFFVSTDGTRVLNYAEWESGQAHIEALSAPGEGVGSGGPAWDRVRHFPGLRRDAGSVKRYRLMWSGFRR